SLAGGPARPLTKQNDAQFWNLISPDGKLVLQAAGVGTDNQGQNLIVDLATGQSRPVSLQPGDMPAAWEKDGRHLFVAQASDESAAIFRIDVS
ncbi:hypothetical protein Q8G41_27430, partial [Klebsiella pneumoniae]|uniref:hypothetical protein n=1 Tax=Klebsiella pneumoniae TaxID=573 RepID=UPI003014031E